MRGRLLAGDRAEEVRGIWAEGLLGGGVLVPPGGRATWAGRGAFGVEERRPGLLGLTEAVLQFLAAFLGGVGEQAVSDQVEEPVGGEGVDVDPAGDRPAVEVAGYGWVGCPLPEGSDPSVGFPK